MLLLPLGATEPHGPHAPLGTDTLISLGICRRAAERLEDDPDVRALVLPPLPYGVTRYGAAFPGARLDRRGDAARARRSRSAGRSPRRASGASCSSTTTSSPSRCATLREAVEELGGARPPPRPDAAAERRAADGRVPVRLRATPGATRRRSSSPTSPALVRRERMEALEAKMIDMPAAIAAGTDRLHRDGDGPRVLRRARRGDRRRRASGRSRPSPSMLVELVREVAAC